jgi:hypothetical protein
LALGVGHRTSHVVATVAKQLVEPLPTWFAPERAYLAVQNALVGIAVGFIYRRAPSPDTAM